MNGLKAYCHSLQYLFLIFRSNIFKQAYMAENYFGITDVGKWRENNEDAFITEPLAGDSLILACVIDGLGGYAGGEVAAAIARDSILEHFRKPGGDQMLVVKEALLAANENIYQAKRQNEDYERMACVATLALADIGQNKFYYAHVGDTRLYLLRDETLVKVTKDHSFVGFLEDSGRLAEADAMKHPKRNEINRALGFDKQIDQQADYIDTGESPFLPGDTMLLCSDGLTDLVNRVQMTALLTSNKSLSEKGRDLINAANEAGGKDNITVVLVRNPKEPVRQKATRPAAAVKKNDFPKNKEVSHPEPPPPEPEMAQKPGKGRVLNMLLLLGLLALAGFLWVFWQKKRLETLRHNLLVSRQNPLEKKLADTLASLNGTTLALTSAIFGQRLLLHDTLIISQDSLHLKGNGLVLAADSFYTGPGLVVLPNCKYVLLDSLIFQNFQTAILSRSSTALHLKNVRFQHCAVPLQYQWSFPNDSLVNGQINGGLFKTDSLAQ